MVGLAGFLLDGFDYSLDDLERLVIFLAGDEWEG
jgi:hypothetical protein